MHDCAQFCPALKESRYFDNGADGASELHRRKLAAAAPITQKDVTSAHVSQNHGGHEDVYAVGDAGSDRH